MRLTVVGCAGSFPGPESPASCYLLEADGFRLVIDLGNGALGALQRYAGLFDVDAICLSHLHTDHCVDLYSYRVAREIAQGGPLPPIPVFGPAGTAERIALVHGPGGDDGLAKRFTFSTLAPGTFEAGPFRITADHVNHPVETFGFRVDHGGRRLAYSADTGKCDALTRLAAGADLLLCEASFLEGPGLPGDVHLTGRQAGEHAARAGAGELVLTHLVVWNDPAASLAEAAGAFGGTVSLAAAGRVIDLV
ncbi:MAG: MBL fold metallo-hydrolase [Streptosporangiaceae bacterium]|nr:MBL fold metallo-hydrolase [Streptosporangiaceae bacterium]MBV9855295.1 MBL fold metallo-hydrolase [Streptosporangiaceae bacterium]